MIRSIYFFIARLLIRNQSDWRQSPKVTDGETLWFHASSAGELEVLIPLIEEAHRLNHQIAVSVFSPSAIRSLSHVSIKTVYRGFSPHETEWEDAFRHFRVKEWITAKYEAWPGVWSSAAKTGVRITVICASLRSSLIWAKRFLKAFRLPLPKLRFFVLSPIDKTQLQSAFPESKIEVTSDPRWIRIIKRFESSSLHPSLSRWKSKYEDRPRPYWVIGSAWEEDLKVLEPELKKFKGTIWIVPHSPNHLPADSWKHSYPEWIWVDEMGFLMELYSLADRIWVGGGFGKGIHSTMEPSVHGVPLACGPKNADQFFETQELSSKGILRVCEDSSSVGDWVVHSSKGSLLDLEEKKQGFQNMVRSFFS